MIKKNYKLLDHTADFELSVKAKSLKGLFTNSAVALFDIIAQRKPGNPKDRLIKQVKIKKSSEGVETLLIEWLNELLYYYATKEFVFTDFKIVYFDENKIEAVCYAEKNSKFIINTEVKAATYHELEIKKNKSGFHARFILDV